MRQLMFSVFDVKAEVFGHPFFMGNTAEAVRAFRDLVEDERSTVHKHPEDYKLCRVASWDNSTGVLVPESPVVTIGFGSEFVHAEVPNGIRGAV